MGQVNPGGRPEGASFGPMRRSRPWGFPRRSASYACGTPAGCGLAWSRNLPLQGDHRSPIGGIFRPHAAFSPFVRPRRSRQDAYERRLELPCGVTALAGVLTTRMVAALPATGGALPASPMLALKRPGTRLRRPKRLRPCRETKSAASGGPLRDLYLFLSI